jgi:flagellar hook-basal body complex protein FliE
MRAKISGSKLDHEETKALMKLTTVDMIAADIAGDKHLKSFGDNLYKMFKRKLKDEDNKKKKETKASTSQEPTLKDVLAAVQGARGGGRSGFGGKGGGGGKGKERPWSWVPYEERTCFLCGKVGHLASQCSEGGKGKSSEGKKE